MQNRDLQRKSYASKIHPSTPTVNPNERQSMREKIVIKIGDTAFLDPSYQDTRNALHSLTHDATTAYGWHHVYNAQRCARLIAFNECHGMRVTVQRYIISDDKTPQLIGDDNG